MAPKTRRSKTDTNTVTGPSKSLSGANIVNYPPFPTVAAKKDLQCNTIEDDQIILIEDLLSPEECKAFVKFIEQLPLEVTPPKKKGEAHRVNHRLSIQSTEFAQHLFSVLKPHLPELPIPPSAIHKPNISTEPHSLNPNIRLYRYSQGEHFGPHYDDSVKDTSTGAKSEWTILIYLTGEAQGVVGGQTVFYRERQGKSTEEKIVVPLIRGTALLHRHGHECMLHEGKEVLKGTKYILRSDVMFKR
ncbi:hypothetical protein BU17DRAFT_44781 [Hysterangium stoloniferum]|nr:hypothetical protein BU17DRAFT_44781 [Hysterangium stoloniferum]